MFASAKHCVIGLTLQTVLCPVIYGHPDVFSDTHRITFTWYMSEYLFTLHATIFNLLPLCYNLQRTVKAHAFIAGHAKLCWQCMWCRQPCYHSTAMGRWIMLNADCGILKTCNLRNYWCGTFSILHVVEIAHSTKNIELNMTMASSPSDSLLTTTVDHNATIDNDNYLAVWRRRQRPYH